MELQLDYDCEKDTDVKQMNEDVKNNKRYLLTYIITA